MMMKSKCTQNFLFINVQFISIFDWYRAEQAAKPKSKSLESSKIIKILYVLLYFFKVSI